MLTRFETWLDVIRYARSNQALYYVPNDSVGPCRVLARPRYSEADGVRLWLRDAEPVQPISPGMIATPSILGKLYRWEVLKFAPT